ncbi:BAG domain-containing protein [Xylariaceae sp. FL0255]|nr:BAG domain-containing protein [Xylariaceae sp. FL0255]
MFAHRGTLTTMTTHRQTNPIAPCPPKQQQQSFQHRPITLPPSTEFQSYHFDRSKYPLPAASLTRQGQFSSHAPHWLCNATRHPVIRIPYQQGSIPGYCCVCFCFYHYYCESIILSRSCSNNKINLINTFPDFQAACPPGLHQDDPNPPVKVASGPPVLASFGAFQNITQLLPPSLQNYVVTTLTHLSDAFAVPNEYITSQGASPTAVYSTVAGAAAVALPLLMSRYGWGLTRDGLSPFASQANSQDVPHVTDEDFSYITSEDLLEHPLPPTSRTYDTQGRRHLDSNENDDLIRIKSRGVTYPVHFPAFSIDDGRLTVQDVRERAGLVMDLSERRASRIKLLYKGRHLKTPGIPIRDYGVKSNSEVMAVVPEGRVENEDYDSSESMEDVIVEEARDDRPAKKKRNKNGKVKKPKRVTKDTLDVPNNDENSKLTTPDPSRHPSRVPSPVVPSGPVEKLATIRSHFDTELLPLCKEFIRRPPKDAKKLEDEHRRLSETTMQHVLLKLDEVDTGGDPEIRARRKDLVNYVQDVLKEIDELLPEGTAKPQR